MKFSFVKVPTKPSAAFPTRYSISIPIIPVRLINPSEREKYFDFKALIDSGADISIFSKSMGEAIGLTVENDKVIEIRGIGGQIIKTYLHKIILGVGGWEYPSIASFGPEDITFPVLGREGFFSLFEVRIDYNKELIDLKPKVDPLQTRGK